MFAIYNVGLYVYCPKITLLPLKRACRTFKRARSLVWCMKYMIISGLIACLLFLAACESGSQDNTMTDKEYVSTTDQVTGVSVNVDAQGNSVTCTYDDQDKNYVSRSRGACDRIKFACPQDKTYFVDECGCGCSE